MSLEKNRGGVMVATMVLEASSLGACGFESHPRYQRSDILEETINKFYGPKSSLRVCDCCKKFKWAGGFCGLYDVCADCAWCESLGQCETCCHEECK